MDSTMKRIGEMVTHEEVNAELTRIGEPVTSRETFWKHYIDVFGKLPPNMKAAFVPDDVLDHRREVAAETLHDIAPSPIVHDGMKAFDRLEGFLKFSGAVIAVGGTATARKYHDMIDQLATVNGE